jgi:integrase/recombinase XerD
MPVKLSTTVRKIDLIPNPTNAALLREFSHYMVSNGSSESRQNNNLKLLTAFAAYLGSNVTFLDIKESDPIIHFLDGKLKSTNGDPERKSIITWNDYLSRIKYFFRWLHNNKEKDALIYQSEWITPHFARIKEKKTKRLSPYSETELWEQEEILSIVKYEPYKRNKAALTLFWDLDARNHEVTMLRIKHIRLREKYGEGEIPYKTKTGSGPALLTCSFPYVRDWLNEHPFRNEPNARLICNIHTGAPVKPDAMWRVMKQLRNRIMKVIYNSLIFTELRRILSFH